MSSARRTMITVAMAAGVLAVTGIGAAGAITSSSAPQSSLPVASSTPWPGPFATPNQSAAVLAPLPAMPTAPWSATDLPVGGASPNVVDASVLALRPNSLAPNG